MPLCACSLSLWLLESLSSPLLSISTAVCTVPYVVGQPRRKMEGHMERVEVVFVLALCQSSHGVAPACSCLTPFCKAAAAAGGCLAANRDRIQCQQTAAVTKAALSSLNVTPHAPNSHMDSPFRDLLSSLVLPGSHPLSYQNGSRFILPLNPFHYGEKLPRLDIRNLISVLLHCTAERSACMGLFLPHGGSNRKGTEKSISGANTPRHGCYEQLVKHGSIAWVQAVPPFLLSEMDVTILVSATAAVGLCS